MKLPIGIQAYAAPDRTRTSEAEISADESYGTPGDKRCNISDCN